MCVESCAAVFLPSPPFFDVVCVMTFICVCVLTDVDSPHTHTNRQIGTHALLEMRLWFYSVYVCAHVLSFITFEQAARAKVPYVALRSQPEKAVRSSLLRAGPRYHSHLHGMMQTRLRDSTCALATMTTIVHQHIPCKIGRTRILRSR